MVDQKCVLDEKDGKSVKVRGRNRALYSGSDGRTGYPVWGSTRTRGVRKNWGKQLTRREKTMCGEEKK